LVLDKQEHLFYIELISIFSPAQTFILRFFRLFFEEAAMLSQLTLSNFRIRLQRGLVFGFLIVTALLAFEVFNYSTTDFALTDLIGDLKFMGVRWATILAIAFCGIDFSGIARLFTPERGREEPTEVWYLFGAWMLAALMNATLTWWGVSIAILNHQTLGNAVVARETLIKVVPIFVAVMVWLIRVLIIGTISMAGDRLFHDGQAASVQQRRRSARSSSRSQRKPAPFSRRPTTQQNPVQARASQPSPKGSSRSEHRRTSPEPTYHPVSLGSAEHGSTHQQSRF
jgi:hypothetical protein